MNETRKYQTFYKDMERYEIDGMFLSNGFREFNKYPAGKNIAKLYKMSGSSPITPNVLTASIIRQYVKGDEELKEKTKTGIKLVKQKDNPVINDPLPSELSEENIYANALSNLPPGDAFAIDYQNLVAAIMLKLFSPGLRDHLLEQKLHEGRKRIDIVFNNRAESGFFYDIINKNKIHAPYILIECKNYENDVGNKEIDQINGRFNRNTGYFGFLAYRRHKNEDKLFKNFVDYRTTGEGNKCIIPINDDDLIEMLNVKQRKEDVNDFLFSKLQRLDFNP